MESKTTSSLKALLLRAWRERWTDLQWGINIKTVLPRGVSGDVYNLADCILQQAVVGSGANQLALSYLKHSLSSQLVSHAAVLQRVSKYSQMHKVHCVYSLLEFVEEVLPGVTCGGIPEETVLATALLSTALWFLQVLHCCSAHTDVISKTTMLLQTLLASDFYVAMMCLAKYSDPDVFMELVQKCDELENTFADTDDILRALKVLKQLDVATLMLPAKADEGPGALVQTWIAVELVREPGCPTPILVNQLKLLQRLKSLTDARLYAELMRASLLSLQDVIQLPYESQWGAFAFLKVPHVLAAMVGKGDPAPIAKAIDLLQNHIPLIDAIDARCICSSLECLLGELHKVRLITEAQMQAVLQRRDVPAPLLLDSAPPPAGIPKVVICAEPTLTGILKTMSTEYHKIQEALLSMLYQVLVGKSFELILAVATVQGQLNTLASRLIRFNECSKVGGDKTRAQLFDISFLMLVSIVQNYGAEVVLDDGGDSTLEQWVQECMVEVNRPKPPEQLLRLADQAAVDTLLQQFNAGELDLKGTMKWHEVLFSMAGVMREVLMAWEQGSLLPADVKRILDAVRGRMCCLSVAAAAWLCAYMRTAPQDTILKPVNMVQQLLAQPLSEDDNLRERWQLSCEIIRRMQRDVQLPLPASRSGGGGALLKQPAAEQLHTLWRSAITRGWLDHGSARSAQSLLEMAGSRWLVAAVIHELFQLRYRDQLRRGVDLALAIFHFDIGACAVELLAHTLPQHLHNGLRADALVEPQLSALAQLTVYAVYAACDLATTEENAPGPPPAKQPRPHDHLDQVIVPLRHLFVTMEAAVLDGFVTQQTYFAFSLLRWLVEVHSPSTALICGTVPPALISDLLRILPDSFTPRLLLHLHDVNTCAGRSNVAKDLCMLRNYQLRMSNGTSV